MSLSVPVGNVRAEETGMAAAQDSEIVFLLDTSGSMNIQDRDRMVIDAIRQTCGQLRIAKFLDLE